MEIYKFLGVEEITQKSVYLSDFLNHAAGSSKVHSVTRMSPWQDPTPSSPWVSQSIITCSLSDWLNIVIA